MGVLGNGTRLTAAGAEARDHLFKATIEAVGGRSRRHPGGAQGFLSQLLRLLVQAHPAQRPAAADSHADTMATFSGRSSPSIATSSAVSTS
jgi:hypothetical protein